MQYGNVDRVQNTKFYIGWIVSLFMLLGMSITSYATDVSIMEIKDDGTCYGAVKGQYTKHAETHEIPTDEYWVLDLEGEILTAKWYCTKEAKEEEQALYILDVVGDRYVYYGNLVDDRMTIEVDLSSYVDGVYYLQLNNEGNFGQNLTIHRNVRKFTMLKENENVYFIYTQKGAREIDMLRQLNELCDPEHYNKGVSWLAEEEAKENIDEIERMAKQIVKDCDTDAEKIYAIYDWLISNIAYDYSYADESFIAGTTFANQKGVCEGQSNLCAIMMQAVNIPCITIRTVREENHKYNAVYYNGSWRYIDVTNGYYTLPAWCEEWLWTTQSCEADYCSIVNMAWGKRPTKTSFVQGEEFQCDGWVELKEANGQSISLDVVADSCSGYDTSQLGKQTVTVSIANKKLTYEIMVVEKKEKMENGDRFEIDNVTYEVADEKKKLLKYKKNGSASAIVRVPDKVSIGNETYKIIAIADNAFKNNKKVTKVVLGKNVKSIGKNAFKGCTKLKTVEVKSTTLNKIGANAFDSCKKLTKITLKTTKLTKKSIGKNALKGTHKKLVIKAPKKMVKKYKGYFKSKGNKKVSVKKC